MIKRIFAFVAFITAAIGLQAAVGDWVLYPSYHNSKKCEKAGDRVYILASGALYSYNTDDNEMRLYDKINTLSDIDIIDIGYSNSIDALVVVYENANIDILYNDGQIYNISDFKNKTLPKKKINGIDIQGTAVYISTEFGVIELDIERMEFRNTYTTDLNTYCTYLFKNSLYTGTEEGVFRCDTQKNLLDKNNWEKVNYYPTQSFTEMNGELYCLISNLGIYTLDHDSKKLKQIIKRDGEVFRYLKSSDGCIVSGAKDKIAVIDSKGNKIYPIENGSEYIIKDNDIFWNCNGYKGFTECRVDNDRVVASSNPITPDSPIRNYCEFMKFSTDGKLLVAGGNLNYFDITFYDGTLMEYDCGNDKWLNFPEETIKDVTGLRYVNICSVDEDPTEKGHIFASSFGYGIYEFRNGEFIKHYNHLNSALESVHKSGPYMDRYVRVPMVKFDSDGNLWCINTSVENIVKVLLKDGNWISLNYKEIEKMPTMVKPLLDSRGWLWITSLQGIPGLFCAKTNNTLFDTSDDVTRTWTDKFKNQDGTSYDVYQVYALTEDMDGDIWVGTNIGVFVIDNPEKFFNDGVFTQIKVPRNDGTGLADYLLSGIYIKAIEVDGANRKWIGTNDNGIYLISPDGLETIHHFTTENSPLPSNCIESIAINEISGEVFIGTDKGIASYKSDAVKPQEKLDKGNIHAYPNPVRADYNGGISIVGLTYECNVKIVDAAGYLINEGKSNGGQYVWNGRKSNGEKVSSGVYYVLTYDSNGNEGETTKILITR